VQLPTWIQELRVIETIYFCKWIVYQRY